MVPQILFSGIINFFCLKTVLFKATKPNFMKSPIFRVFPAFIFTAVAVLAITREQDYVEGATWLFFALAVALPALPFPENKKRMVQLLAALLFLVGITLLVLRMLNILPVPVRPLP